VVTLIAPEAIAIEIVNKTEVDCNGGNNGTIQIEANGGNSPLTYLWSNGETSANLNNLVAGPYTLTVTDANECSSEMVVIIEEPTLITSSIEVTNNNRSTSCH